MHVYIISLQTRSLAVQKTEEGELDEEAEWIFQNVFSKHPISKQVRDTLHIVVVASLLPRLPLESLEARLCDCSASMFTLSGAMKPFVLRLCFNQNLQS